MELLLLNESTIFRLNIINLIVAVKMNIGDSVLYLGGCVFLIFFLSQIILVLGLLFLNINVFHSLYYSLI